MNEVLLKKLLIEAYIAGAESIYCGCYPRPTKADAKEWYEENYPHADITLKNKKE